MVLALFFASIVTLFLLVENWIRVFNGQTEAHVMQAGLYGASFLAAAYVVNRLADKLIQQETLARQRGLDLQVQQAINRLVIADMDDGVLVVGSDSTVYACNPSAQYELGLLLPDHVVRPKLTEIPYLKPLADAFFAWHANRLAPLRSRIDPVNFLIIKPADDAQWREANSMFGISGLGMHLKVRFANVSTDTIPEERTVIFLQDVARIDHQAQQLKLASMGRLTASVAHEVRNPLSAIAHASSLLSEEATTPSQQRLLKIVADNVGRMNRMVEDILKLSRKAQSHETFLLSELVLDTISSFEDTHALKDGLILADDLRQHRVRFDPMHLREVLLNLLNNAIRYASGQPGSIRIHAAQASYNRLELHVQDDGPSITPEVRAHLFEPFYTTSSHGTGLGLYLARELCSNNGAMLDYEFHNESAGGSHTASSGRFVITFASDIKPQESL